MAITYVGGKTAAFAGSTATNQTVALNSGLTGGTDSAVQAGDLVVVAFAAGSTADRSLLIQDPSAVAYTLAGSELYANGTSYDANLRVAYKRMGSTPDASVTIGPTGATADGGAYAIHVYRGVDSSTPMDVTPTTATGTATTRSNPPSITPTTTGAVVLAATAGACATGTTAYTFSGATNLIQSNQAATNDGRVSMATYAWTSGALDPAASSTGSNNAADSWAAVTLALRPAAVGPKPVLEASGFTQVSLGSGVTHNGTGVTVPSGLTNSLLVVFATTKAAADSTVSSANWNGSAMTLVHDAGYVTNDRTVLATIKSPAAGNNTLQLNFSGSSQTRNVIYGWAVFSGVDQTSPTGDVSQNTTGGSAMSVAPIGVENSYALAHFIADMNPTPGDLGGDGGVTDIAHYEATNTLYAAMITQATVIGAHDMYMTYTPTGNGQAIGVVILPAAATSAHDLTATGITASPSVGTPAITQEHNLTAAGVAPPAPSVGSPGIAQRHALTATGIAASTPTVGTPTAAISVSLTASSLAAGAPSVGSPTLAQIYAFIAPALATAAPSVGAPTIAQRHALTATGITASPSVGAPAIGQRHSLTASGVAAGSPTLGAPAIGQRHALTASGITAAPSVGAPTLTLAGQLAALPLAAGTPSVGVPAITQKHALAATGVTATPIVGAATLVQQHGLTASGIVAGAPSVGSPALAQRYALSAPAIATGAPSVDAPLLGQHHLIVAANLSTGAPSVGAPSSTSKHNLAAEDVSTGAPSITAPALSQAHALAAIGISTGDPVVDLAAMLQRHALTAADLSPPAPSVGAPILTGPNILAALDLTMGAPTVGTPLLDPTDSLDRLIRVAATSRLVHIEGVPRAIRATRYQP